MRLHNDRNALANFDQVHYTVEVVLLYRSCVHGGAFTCSQGVGGCNRLPLPHVILVALLYLSFWQIASGFAAFFIFYTYLLYMKKSAY